MNCWEFMKCGLGPGTAGTGGNDCCPAAMHENFNGCNGGVNAGRACWMIAETVCGGKVQGTFVDKMAECQRCPFYLLVQEGESDAFLLAGERPLPPDDGRRVFEAKTISSKMDDELAILYLLKQLGRGGKSRLVGLTNVYKEIPISNRGEILAVQGANVTIATSELQLAAIRACGETFIGLRHFSKSFLCRPVDYDLHASTVTLTDFSFAHLFYNFRHTVRVRLPKPMNVVLRKDNNKFSGTILDISLGGCGMNVLTTYGLEGAGGLSLKLKLTEPVTCQVVEADIPCEVVRIDASRLPYKVALKFVHDKHSETVVSRFINQRQFEILKEIRGDGPHERSYPVTAHS